MGENSVNKRQVNRGNLLGLATNRHWMMGSALVLLCVFLLSSCLAVSRTPPLTGNHADSAVLYGGVAITSGQFKRAHQTIGIIQMTQEGFRNYLFGEINKRGTDSSEIMRTVGGYALAQGADGIQHFSLVDMTPKSEEMRKVEQVGQTLKIIGAVVEGRHGDAGGAAAEGEKTQYLVRGELVKWIEEAPAPVSVVSKATLEVASSKIEETQNVGSEVQ